MIENALNVVCAAAEPSSMQSDHEFVYEINSYLQNISPPEFKPKNTPNVLMVYLQSGEDAADHESAQIFLYVTAYSHKPRDLDTAYAQIKLTFDFRKRTLHVKSEGLDEATKQRMGSIDKTSPWPGGMHNADVTITRKLLNVVDDMCKKSGLYQIVAEAMQADINKGQAS